MYVCFFSLFAQGELLSGLLATLCDAFPRMLPAYQKSMVVEFIIVLASHDGYCTALTSHSWKIKCNFLCRIATIAQETSFATLTPKSHAPGQFSHRLMSWKPNSLKSHISEKSSSNIEEGLKVSTSVLTKLLADGVSPIHFCFSTVQWEAASSWNNFPLDALEFASRFPAVFLVT